MRIRFPKLKLTLKTKGGIVHTIPTRHNKITDNTTSLLEENRGNVDNITLEDDKSDVIEIVTKDKEAK